MPTPITHVIDPDGTGDYTSLGSWEAAQGRDLVALDENAIADCTSSAGSPDTGQCLLSGWTTDGTRDILIKSDQLHDGTLDNTIYRMTGADLVDGTIKQINGGGADDITIQNIQINVLVSFRNSVRAINLDGGVAGTRDIINCLITETLTGAGTFGVGIRVAAGSGFPTKIINCLLYDIFDGANARTSILSVNSSVVIAYNNTIVDSHTGYFQFEGATSITVKNCVCDGCTEPWDRSTGGYGAASTNNASNNQTPPGSNPQTGSTTFLNRAGDDFHLDGADTVCLDNGADLSSDADFPFSNDVDGDTRVVPWDIGFDEFISGVTVVTLDAASAIATAQDVTATPGGVTVGLDAAGATATAQDVVANAGVVVATLQPAGAVAVARDVIVPGLVAITLPFNEEVVAEILPFDEDNQRIDLGGH